VHDVRQSTIEEEVDGESGILNLSLGKITHVFALPMLQASFIQKWCFLKLNSQYPTSDNMTIGFWGLDLISVS